MWFCPIFNPERCLSWFWYDFNFKMCSKIFLSKLICNSWEGRKCYLVFLHTFLDIWAFFNSICLVSKQNSPHFSTLLSFQKKITLALVPSALSYIVPLSHLFFLFLSLPLSPPLSLILLLSHSISGLHCLSNTFKYI